MTTENKDQLIIDLVEELNWQVRDDHRVLALEALRAIGTNDATIKLYFKGEVVLGDVTATLTPAQPVSSDHDLRAAIKPFVEAIKYVHLSDEAIVTSAELHDDYGFGVLTVGDFRQLAAALKAGEYKARLHLFTIKGLAAGVATLSPKSPTYVESVNNAMNLIIRKVDALISAPATPQTAQPVSSDRELRAAVQPFVELWAQWIAHSTDEECADSEILFWQWLNNDTYLKSTHFRQLAAALTAGEQGGELWTT